MIGRHHRCTMSTELQRNRLLRRIRCIMRFRAVTHHHRSRWEGQSQWLDGLRSISQGFEGALASGARKCHGICYMVSSLVQCVSDIDEDCMCWSTITQQTANCSLERCRSITTSWVSAHINRQSINDWIISKAPDVVLSALLPIIMPSSSWLWYLVASLYQLVPVELFDDLWSQSSLLFSDEWACVGGFV